MREKKDRKDTDFSFMKEKIKQEPIYQNKAVIRCLWALVSGAIFAATALVIWVLAVPKLESLREEKEIQPIEIPKEEEVAEEPKVYITETISMELEDYKKMYQQLLQISNQTSKSLVNISVMSTDTDWFEEIYTSQHSVCGVLIGDNGLELLILTEYEAVQNGESLLVTFFDHTTAEASIKKYDRNTGLAVVSVNLSDLADTTRSIIAYANLGSSKTARTGEPVIAVGNPAGNPGSVLFGNLTSVSQEANLYDGCYSILTTDMNRSESGSGVLVDWNGKIIGLLQDQYEVSSQEDTVQAYGISDMKNIIEHLSNNQDIVYLGIVGQDVTTAVSIREQIPVGVYVSEVEMDSPAIAGGIQPGDIITSISGQSVTNQKDIMSILLKCSNGQNIEVRCQRPARDGYQELGLIIKLKILE